MVKKLYLDNIEDRRDELEKLKKTVRLKQLLTLTKEVGSIFKYKEFSDMEKFLNKLIEEV